MDNPGIYRVAIVGAGPRGTSVLERILSNQQARGGARLRIHLVDPFPPGPGHVWQPNQSRLFLMNTPCLFPTVVPAPGTDQVGPDPVAGMTFEAWRSAVADGNIPDVPPADAEEAAALGPADFPSRALYGRYLAWTFAHLAARTGADASLTVHAAEATGLARHDGGWQLELDDGTTLPADAVVLALGHVPAALNPEQQQLQDAAARHGLNYLPPNVPADVDWGRLPPGRTVLVRGMGLNFFDLMVQVTEGRGGRFLPATDSQPLTYLPSGKEPRLVAGSRRGTPYRAKASINSYIPAGVELQHFTTHTARLFAEAGVQPGFDHDLWPMLHRDVYWTYYSTLAREQPECLKVPPQELLAGLDHLLAEKWEPGNRTLLTRVRTYLAERVSEDKLLDVEALAKPFGGRKFGSAAEYQQAVLGYLDADAEGSARGTDDPLKMAVGALNAGRSLLKKIVADGGITEESWLAELRGWFEPLVEGLASGPPVQRIEQLAALARAGVVQFAGPEPVYQVDPATGRFRVTSPWVDGAEYSAAYLVEAMMPVNRVAHSRSPLLRRMFEDGLARPKLMIGPNGAPVTGSGLDVTQPPYRPLDRNGQPVQDLYVIGLQLSAVQWGTSIAAEAGASGETGGRTLQDADRIARAILDAADQRSLAGAAQAGTAVVGSRSQAG
ncbi:hypothetical protein E4J89_16045 [Arthrobacter sp. CAU 1506]|uniref:FAD/NAD(P)-binding protein n=1 Tax=Arthrobacter sp. CAU 1506 TaxID=2560052 RepID=UPI0010AB8C40|nr:FAD/NAD(P)-binding domain-containing protein [Arthrobacter sp. CAU 1506]TJY67216.1 hypothetical protein E4J89_16045 [Arthrobacter sp. CAU 1506]